MEITPNEFRKAIYFTLCLSILGLVAVCLPIIGPRYTLEFAGSFGGQIAVGYTAMILVIEFVGMRCRSKLCRNEVGALFAVLLFFTGAFWGSAISMLLYRDFDFPSYVIKPLCWLVLFGTFPAAVFGLIGAGVLRRICNRNPPRPAS